MTLFIQLILYSIVGVIATVIDFVVFFFLINHFNMAPLLATAFSFAVALQANFFLCNRFIFAPQKSRVIYQLIMTYAIASIGLLLNVLFFWVFLHWLPLFWAKLVVVPLVMIWNFGARRKFIYCQALNPRISALLERVTGSTKQIG